MPRYVDADWLLERAVPMGWSTPKWVSDILIEDAPTADVVEVVLCKDCKCHEDEEPAMVYCPHIVGGWVSEDFFCESGERRENG